MTSVSLVLVCFRSSSYVRGAIERFRRQAKTLGVKAEVVVVDHSQDPDEVRALQDMQPDSLIVQTNRGYAAGVNSGVARASGDIVLVSNPDVELEGGALGSLLVGLDRHAIVGPQFLMGELMFPPMEPQLPGAELLRLCAGRFRGLRKRLLAKEARRAIAVWEARETVPLRFLGGALLALRRETFLQLGPWDEGYFLYFEETDWLLRARRRGLSCALVPAARAQHRWGMSATPSDHAHHMLASRRRYYRKNFGWVGSLIAACPLPKTPFPARPVPITVDAREPLWWLVSPSPLGVPAFGLKGTTAFPETAIRSSLAFDRHPRTLLVAGFGLGGTLCGPWRWDA
ncbi:hypothetical protein EG19_10800 [Thermoanaerobaculum aquaticum]|uniref:Glycosyltransferase 2-like domain-containing protein n=1 Tax=Thermoanaerobaculum aquaticum TaxID=1312852 RepID=A0A062Y1I2_9BACT|nr:hypothetical protein EG19_10800 [Thermoanaerobaculum aquaticum]